MQINDFCRIFSESDGFRKKSRLLIIPNDQERAQIRTFLSGQDCVARIRISDCVTHNNFLPAPPRLFLDLSQSIAVANQNGKIAFVQGFDAIMELWALPLIAQGYETLRDLLDNQTLSFLLISQHYGEQAREAFRHPRYEGGQTVLRVGQAASSLSVQHKIRLIDNGFKNDPIPGRGLGSLSSFIREHEDGLLTEAEANIFVDFHGAPLAGIDEGWDQIYSRRQFLTAFCALDDELSDPAIDWLYEQSRDNPRNGLEVVRKHFFRQGIGAPETLKHAPELIFQSEPHIKELLIWMLRSSLSDGCYLYAVLTNPDFSAEHFLEFYVCEALNLLESGRTPLFAEERKSALQQIGTALISGELALFIRQCQKYPVEQVAPWFNLQTAMEKHELLRRFTKSSEAKIPPTILKVYPLLRAYMEPYQLGLIELNQYFDDYRLQKLKDHVTSDFCERAKQVKTHLPGISDRDALVQEYVNEDDTALLVVDGLGAEYLPLLISLAQKRNIGVFSAEPAFVKLPSSTEFNPIQWPENRRLPEIKSLDNYLHNGSEMHSVKSQEEDFVTLLEIFDGKILPAVAESMTRFSQIILTSDHGATRLAACANQQGLARTIPMPDGIEISDWRYTKTIPGVKPDDALMENLAGTHWIVRGYDRLPKKGPKLHEMHGGATYEECLVPFVVFKQGAVFVPKAQQTHNTGSEFVENTDFDL